MDSLNSAVEVGPGEDLGANILTPETAVQIADPPLHRQPDETASKNPPESSFSRGGAASNKPATKIVRDGDSEPSPSQPTVETSHLLQRPEAIANKIPVETSFLLPSGESANKPTPLPKLQVAALLFVFLPESVTSTLIYPFIVQLVRSLNIVKGDPASVGYYSGLIESCFFVTEAIFVFFWARVSDKVGRKPVILFGSFGLSIALLCFGLSTSLFGVMASRALQGALNGNTGVVRAMLSEVTDSSNRAQAFSFTPIVWASGSTLGPLVGGMLADPANRFPAFKNWFWHRHPYLLPSMAAALLSLVAFTCTVFFIKEVIASSFISKFTGLKKPAHISYGTITQESNGHSLAAAAVDETSTPIDDSKISDLFTKRLICVLVNHALLAVLDHSYIALVAVFLATPITSGGLGLSPWQIGGILGMTGLVHGVLQAFCFAPLYRTFDPKQLYTFCIGMIIPAYACFPFINGLARAHGVGYPGLWVLLIFQLFLLLPSYTAFSAMFIFISNSSPTPALLGTTNGLAQTIFSSMGAIGPAGVTSLFALSMEHNLLGGHLVYVIMCSLGAIAVLASIYLLPEKPGEEVAPPSPWRYD
ncbi:MFS general substrate transporter [Ramaria rubella]|nr:MFS general substrate transporter [Ramaria rubella]